MNHSKDIFTEQELVDGILRSDTAAFNYLYEHYAGSLFRNILKIVPDEIVAADILQNVFLNIFLKISTYHTNKGRLFTWILNIARNESIDMLRSNAYSMSKRTIRLEHSRNEEKHDPYRKIDVMKVNDIVLRLPPDLRNLIILSFYYGFSHQQIAVLFHMPLGTVKTKMSRAYRLLKDLLEKQ